MASKAFAGVGSPKHELLGAGAVYFNWGLSTETLIGVTKGGTEFTDGAEFRMRESDSDYAPVKGHTDLIKMVPRLKIKALKTSSDNLEKFFSGMDEYDAASRTRIYRTMKTSTSYITNVAFVQANRDGETTVIVLKNALGDGAITVPSTAKGEEVILDVQFTAHIDDTFDPNTENTYPYYIERSLIKRVNFIVKSNDVEIADALFAIDGQTRLTKTDGSTDDIVLDSGTYTYTVSKTGYITLTGSLTVNVSTPALMNVTIVAV